MFYDEVNAFKEPMNILVACEESQRVCLAFRKKGHHAFSCDIIDCSGGYPEYHIKTNVISLLNGNCIFDTMDGRTHYIKGKWDMIIAFPPCTYLSNAGARWLYKGRKLNEERYEKGLAAKEFFMRFYNADCKRICVENPLPSRIYELPPHTQEIQPYLFGHPYSKKTLLWLKGLLPLVPTNMVNADGNTFTAWTPTSTQKGEVRGAKNYAKTFEGVAEAMAEQWG